MQSLAEQQAAHEVRDVMMRAQQAEACQQEASTQIIPNPVASTDFLQLLMVQCQLADRSLWCCLLHMTWLILSVRLVELRWYSRRQGQRRRQRRRPAAAVETSKSMPTMIVMTLMLIYHDTADSSCGGGNEAGGWEGGGRSGSAAGGGDAAGGGGGHRRRDGNPEGWVR